MRPTQQVLQLFLLSSSLVVVVIAAAASAGSETPGVVSKHDFLQLPLIPYHQQVMRSRRLSLADSSGLNVTTSWEDSVDRSHYPRRQLASKNKEKDGNALQVGALYQGYGTHYADLWVGTPPQRQTLIVDTGSGVTAFPCSGCRDCGAGKHIDEFFQETASSTFQKVSCGQCQRGRCQSDECRIGMSYQEGSSWNAFEGIDTVYIAGPHDHALEKDGGKDSDLDPNHAKHFSFDMDFGCQTRLTGLFKTQLADGIMGMDNAKTAFWAQAHQSKILPDQIFGLCFSRQPTARREGTESGAVTLGGYDKRLHNTPLVYTSNKKYSGGFFAVHVRKIYLRPGGGGDSAKSIDDKKYRPVQLKVDESSLNHGNVIVDSGTTDTYFSRRITHEFRKIYMDMTGMSYGHQGMTLTEKELNDLPTILIQIAGDDEMNQLLFPTPEDIVGLAANVDPENPWDVLLAIPPSHYMEYEAKRGQYVARFYDDEAGGSVLGANAMMGHDVVFDVDNKRVSFAESQCDYTHLVEDNGFDFDLNDGQSKKTETSGTDDKGAAGKSKEADKTNKDKPENDTKTPDEKSPDSPPEKVDDDDDVDDDAGATYINPHSGGNANVAEPPSLIRTMDGCKNWTCRFVAIGSLTAFLVAGIMVGQGCKSKPSAAYRQVSTFDGDFDEHEAFATKCDRDTADDEDDEDGMKDEESPRLELSTR